MSEIVGLPSLPAPTGPERVAGVLARWPAPWREDVNDDGEVWVVAANGARVFYVGDMEETEMEDHALAQLAAALPDLLSACEHVGTTAARAVEGEEFTDEELSEMFVHAGLAVARARGELAEPTDAEG